MQTERARATLSTSIKMPVELRKRLQHLAEVRQRTLHAVMLHGLETYVSREEMREALRQEALAAHEAYMQTGLHVAEEEADAWLAELEAGNDAEPPKCHV